LIDPAVLFLIEVVGLEERGDPDYGIRIDQDRAKHSLLGFGVGRY
jgi:hypothetical protein